LAVSPEPERGSPEGIPGREPSERGQQGSKRELLAETNEINITSGLLIFAENNRS
jgi:hypothetical protein